MNSKYSNVLTVLLVIVIIAIIGIIGFLGYRYYQNYAINSSSEDFVDSFLNDSSSNSDSSSSSGSTIIDDDLFSGIESTTTSTSGSVQTYKGYVVAGTIEIPAINLSYPIIARSEYSTSALETSVVELYGVGLNQVGNTTIAGHNYRNGTFFSNNKKLTIGDKIYITDLTGTRLSYTIYNKYETDENDADYMTRDTEGAIEVSLTTCTDDSSARLIIWAKADSE